MSHALLIRDETITGRIESEQTIYFPIAIVSVKDIITQRVKEEVTRRQDIQAMRAFEEPRDLASRDKKAKSPKNIDVEVQIEKAFQLFNDQQIILLINNRQAEYLEEQVVIMPETVVSFLKLVPLVGG